MSNPVVVDFEDATVHPPLIINVASTCIDGFGVASILLMNIDSFHYPMYFTAIYDWSLSDGASVVDSGSLKTIAWEPTSIYIDGLTDGAYSLTIADTDLGVSSATDIVVDCANPPFSADPLPPLVLVPAVTCSEDSIDTGAFTFFVNNQAGDEGGMRSYDFTVLWQESMAEVDAGTLTDVGEGQTATRELFYLWAGTFVITVTDTIDPAQTTTVSVEVPVCPPDPPPPADPVTPLFPPKFVHVSTTCADPALDDGSALLTVFSNNYLHLGGTGKLWYEWALSDGTSEIAGYTSFFWPGVNFWPTPPLPPGEYTATIVVTLFPSMTDSVTFTIDDCSDPPPTSGGPPIVHDVTTVCKPEGDTETVMLFVANPGPTTDFSWTISDGQVDVAVSDPWGERWYVDSANLMVVSHLPVGSLEFSAAGIDDPLITVSATIDIGPCGDPVDPVDPVDPTEEIDSTDPADPTVPSQASEPDDSTTPTTPSESTDGGGSTDPPPAGGFTGGSRPVSAAAVQL